MQWRITEKVGIRDWRLDNGAVQYAMVGLVGDLNTYNFTAAGTEAVFRRTGNPIDETLGYLSFKSLGEPLKAQTLELINCKGTFTASIYQGTKTTDATIRTENLATGVTRVLVTSNAGTGNVAVYNNGVNIGTVFDGDTTLFTVVAGTVGWSSATAGTIELGQGVA